MTADPVLRDVRVLIDRYLEVSNHYARELRNHLREYKNSPSRLSALINSLEAIESSVIDATRGAEAAAAEEPALGQNIVRTSDTLAALRISADEILERLDAPIESVPRNLWWLKSWLKRDVAEIAAGFPSFTYAWDKLIDLNRLTLAPDSRFLRVRDNVSLATMEFERFVLALRQLSLLVEPSGVSSGTILEGPPNAPVEAALKSLCTPLMTLLDQRCDERVKRVFNLLQNEKDSLEQEMVILEATRDLDALAILGLELGFTSWLGFTSLTIEHRKTIIMSLIICSKQFLVEASWKGAKEFSAFAVALTTKMNVDLGLDAAEGTAMLRFNKLWAQHKLGENINEEVEQWDVSGLHSRYNFLKFVLLRKFDDAVRLLETLLPKKNSGEAGNFSLAEAEEWPILEDLRSSDQYVNFKQRLSEPPSG